MYWPGSLERIKTYHPGIKLLLVLRNPIYRAYSHWVMTTSRGRDALSFDQAIRAGRCRVSAHPDSLHGHNRLYSYVERGFYADQVARMFDLFPRNQLLILKHDDMVSDLNRFLDVVTSFIGVPRFPRYPKNELIRPVSPSTTIAPMSGTDRDYLFELYREDIRKTQSMTGLDLGNWLEV